MAGTSYTVKQGDTIFSIADSFGFRSIERILGAAGNEAARNKLAALGHLVAGDILAIPEKEPLSFDRIEPGKVNTITIKLLKASIALYLEDEDEHPYAEKDYALIAYVPKSTGDGFEATPPYRGKTDGDGYFSQSVPVRTVRAQLELWPTPGDEQSKITWELELGAPAAEV